MRKSFKKLQSRILNHRFYKNFSNKKSTNCLSNELRKKDLVNNDKCFERFCNINMKLLNKHAPWNKKFVRGNQMPFITKDLSKEIMKRSRMRNRLLKNSLENRMLYTQLHNKEITVYLFLKTLKSDIMQILMN